MKWSDLVYRDPGKHWCQVTTRWLSSFSALLSHLHSEEYHSKLPLKEKPWKKRLDIFNSTVQERDAIKESLNEPIELSKGSEFIVPIQAKVQYPKFRVLKLLGLVESKCYELITSIQM